MRAFTILVGNDNKQQQTNIYDRYRTAQMKSLLLAYKSSMGCLTLIKMFDVWVKKELITLCFKKFANNLNSSNAYSYTNVKRK